MRSDLSNKVQYLRTVQRAWTKHGVPPVSTGLHDEKRTHGPQQMVLERLCGVSAVETTSMWPPPLRRGGRMFARSQGNGRNGTVLHRRTPIVSHPRAFDTCVG